MRKNLQTYKTNQQNILDLNCEPNDEDYTSTT